RRAAAGGEVQQLAHTFRIRTLVLDGPQLRRERARRRLEQPRQIYVIGTEAHAIFAQGCARGLIKAFDFLRHLLSFKHAKRFDELEGNATRHSGDVLGGGEREQRCEQLLDVSLEPEVEAVLHQFARGTGKMLVGDDTYARTQGIVAGSELADKIAGPAQGAVGSKYNLIV